MFKYLRVAVTALCLTACVLLLAMWVRSYRDYRMFNVYTAISTFRIDSGKDRLSSIFQLAPPISPPK
jgi:hypothetical protein